MKEYLSILSTIFFLFLTPRFFAQQLAEHTVYFDSGKDTPTRKEKEKLDQVLQDIANKKLNYSISIYGHTDNTGSSQFNKELSDRRAKNVAAYLKKEFKTSQLEIAGKSYTEPVSTDTTVLANARNRRVYISISIPVPQINTVGAIKLDKREYTVDADKNDTLLYPSGTKLMIKSGIFVDELGNKIKGNVTISYVEFRDPVDFILAGAHMYYSDKGENMVFNSSGMFNISGSQEGKPVFIKKGEEIQIAFVPTKKIEPGTDFYKYNTSQNKWSDLSKLQSKANGTTPIMHGHGALIDQLEICSKDMCEGIKMVVELGGELTKNKIPVFTNIVNKYNLDVPLIRSLDNEVKKYDTELKVVKKTLDSIRKELNADPAYIFRKINSPSSSAYAFKIECDTSLKNNFIDMENVTWSCNSYAGKRAVSKFMNSKVYSIRVTKIDSKGNAELRVTRRQFDKKKTILNVKMELPEENTKMERKEIYKTYRQRVKSAREYNKSIENEQKIAQAKMNYLEMNRKIVNDSLNRELRSVNGDSVKCFWANNKPLMKPDEKEMIMVFWYEHFQKNMDAYGRTYSQMRSSNAVGDTCAAVTKRAEAAALRVKLEENTQVAAAQIMVSLSVGSFGIFNCDQIERLKNPNTIIASYADADGKALRITSVYLIDDAINSVLIYNGFLGFSPSTFPYNPRSNNRLIAFDEKGDPWLCSYEHFKQAVKAEGNKTFILKKVDAAKSKEELSAMN